jgi:hypothetical protein
MRSVIRVGPATISEVRSGSCRAMDLGASSPTTTCRKVIIANATPAERLCETPDCSEPGNRLTIGRSRCDNAGSPIQPNPRLARVMPSCVPER